MKRLMFCLLLTGCATNGSFHYGSHVQISNGFYRGCRGEVTNLTNVGYEVWIQECNARPQSFITTLSETELE